jgi:hypothetical protein
LTDSSPTWVYNSCFGCQVHTPHWKVAANLHRQHPSSQAVSVCYAPGHPRPSHALWAPMLPLGRLSAGIEVENEQGISHGTGRLWGAVSGVHTMCISISARTVDNQPVPRFSSHSFERHPAHRSMNSPPWPTACPPRCTIHALVARCTAPLEGSGRPSSTTSQLTGCLSLLCSRSSPAKPCSSGSHTPPDSLSVGIKVANEQGLSHGAGRLWSAVACVHTVCISISARTVDNQPVPRFSSHSFERQSAPGQPARDFERHPARWDMEPRS